MRYQPQKTNYEIKNKIKSIWFDFGFIFEKQKNNKTKFF